MSRSTRRSLRLKLGLNCSCWTMDGLASEMMPAAQRKIGALNISRPFTNLQVSKAAHVATCSWKNLTCLSPAGAPLGTLATLATHFAKDTTSLGQQPRASTRVNDLIPWNIWFLEWAAAKTSICKSCAKLFHKAFHEAFKLLALKSFNMFQYVSMLAFFVLSLRYPFGLRAVDSQLELRQGDWVPDPRKLPRGASCAGSNRMIPMMHQI